MDLRFLETIKDKQFTVCNPSGIELKIIDHREEKLDMWLNDIWNLSFTVDNLKRDCSDYNDYYDLIIKDRIIKIENIGEFLIIECPEYDNGTSKTKQVTCKSIEYEIAGKNVPYMKCQAYKFYDILPVDIPNTFMGIVMSYLPNWTIGHIDTSLYNLYRVFDISVDTSLYNIMIEQAQPSYECIFQFDRLNKTINAYTKNNIIKDTDLILSFDNLVNEINITPIYDGLCTALTVTGANDMGINMINPIGTNTLYNLNNVIDVVDSNRIRLMSLETSNAWKAWKAKYDELEVGYANNNTSIKNKKAQILTYQAQLTTLNGEIKALKDSIAIFKTFNEDKTALVNEYNVKVTQANTIEANISTLKTQITTLENQKTNTNYTLKHSNFFTINQLKELDRFIKIASYTDENFAITDSMTDVQVIEMSQELFDKGIRELNILSKPRYSFDVNMLCPLFIDNFITYKQQLEFGSKVTLYDSRNNYYYPLLIGISISFDNLDDVKFTFSESLRNQDNEFDINQLLGQTANVATNLAINNIKYNSYVDSGDKQTLEKMRTEALDVDKQALINGADKTITIDNTGILCRALDTNGVNGYSPYQSWWNDNILMFSDDYFKHAKMGIGLISLPNGQKAYGVNAQVLLGDMIIGSNLGIHNANNSFIVDESGATLTNATFSIIGNGGLNKILLDPINGFKIQKKVNTTFTDMIYLGTDGSAYFNGNLFGGSININNRFKVNADGSVEMATGTLKSFQSLMANGKGFKVNEGISNVDGDCTITGNLVVRGNTTLGGNITWETHDTKFNDYTNTVNMYAAIKTSADEITSTVSTQINGVNQSITTIRQTSDAIALAVNNNKLIFNSSGLSIYNAGFSIYNGSNKVFYVDTGGNIVTRGYYYGNGVTSDDKGLTILNGKFKITDSSNNFTFFSVDNSGKTYCRGLTVLRSGTSSNSLFMVDDDGVCSAGLKVYYNNSFTSTTFLKLNVAIDYVRIGDNATTSATGYYQMSYSTSTNGYYHYFNGSTYMKNTVTFAESIIFKGKTFNNVKQGSALTSSDYVMVAS